MIHPYPERSKTSLLHTDDISSTDIRCGVVPQSGSRQIKMTDKILT